MRPYGQAVCLSVTCGATTMKQDDLIKGDWRNLNGQLKSTWDKLTDEDLQHPDGDRDYLIDKLQERYGIGREVAAKQVEDFEKARY